MKIPIIHKEKTTKESWYEIEFAKLRASIRKLFLSIPFDLKDWERMESKKSISRIASPTSNYEKTVH